MVMDKVGIQIEVCGRTHPPPPPSPRLISVQCNLASTQNLGACRSCGSLSFEVCLVNHRSLSFEILSTAHISKESNCKNRCACQIALNGNPESMSSLDSRSHTVDSGFPCLKSRCTEIEGEKISWIRIL